jgi:hypothetical protein
MGPTGCPETSVTNYQYTLRKSHMSEDLIYTMAEAWKSLYNIRWLVFITETDCLLRGTD